MSEAAKAIGDSTVDAQSQQFLLEQSIGHAWDWFALHATQRMQGVNFFLLAAAFLTGAYVNAMQYSKFTVAGGVAGLGVLFCVVFYLFEMRVRELLKTSEKALAPFQQQLSKMSGVQEFEICKLVEEPRYRFTSYHRVISGLYFLTGIAFLLGGVYALRSFLPSAAAQAASFEMLISELPKILLILSAVFSLYCATRLVLKTSGSRSWLVWTMALVCGAAGAAVLILGAFRSFK